jgi:hypothetical protein
MPRARYTLPAWAIVGVSLILGAAGCGGGSTVSNGTPQAAAQDFLKGFNALNGGAICGVLDETMRRTLVSYTINAHIVTAGASCAKALSGFAKVNGGVAAGHAKLPTLHTTITGDTAVVNYVGAVTHTAHSFALVKGSHGWLIDKVDGKN